MPLPKDSSLILTTFWSVEVPGVILTLPIIGVGEFEDVISVYTG